jgi:hypothetical protein
MPKPPFFGSSAVANTAKTSPEVTTITKHIPSLTLTPDDRENADTSCSKQSLNWNQGSVY